MAGENAATAVATPQPGSTPQGSTVQPGAVQGQSQEPLTAPAIPDPKAFLESWRAKHGWNTEAKPTPSTQPAAPDPAKGEATPEKVASAAPVATNTEPAKTSEEPKDDLAARVAKFSREQRELSARQEAFKAEQARAKTEREEAAKQHEAKLRQADTVERAAKAIENGDIAGALKALKADVNPSAIALQLLEQLQREDERPMSQAEVDRIVSEKLQAQEEARTKAEEAKRKEAEEKQKAAIADSLEGAREQYVNACNGAFSKDKHPFIAAHGLKATDIIAYAESIKDGNMIVPPEPEELLNHFEALYRTRAERAGWAPKVAEAPKATPSPSFSPSSLVQDSGGRLVNPGPRKTLDEVRAELKQKLRVGGLQT